MLDLRSCHDALDHFHHRFLDESLPSSLSREAIARFDSADYSTAELAWGITAWQERALDEYRSQVAFTELLGQLTSLGFAFDVLGVVTRVVRDEARHVEMCRRLVCAFGGSDILPGMPAYVRRKLKQRPLLRVLRTVVCSLCVGETLSVRLIAAVRTGTVDPLTHCVMTQLAADEAIHARVGWDLLGLIWPIATKADRAAILAELPSCLAGAEAAVVPARLRRKEAPKRAPLGPLNPFGAIPVGERVRVFYEALERDVLTRFETLGIPARRAFDKGRP